MKKWILFFSLLMSSHFAFAQNPTIEVIGKVVESNSKEAVEFATVMIADAATKDPLTGTTTDVDGNFSLRTTASRFYVEVSFIGYVTQKITDIEVVNGKVDLQTIVLGENSQTLDEVVVRAEKSQTEFKLDKRVFNVGKDLSSTGASALEVLNNVPSVAVSIEGTISLRGSSGVQILINGKPSVLASEEGNALGTITAEMIEKIEVITNPSAKYDAEGTAGIINIVIKKEEKNGLNGAITLNTGTPNNHSVGLSLNRRTDKFNLFSQIGAGYRTFPSDNETINRDLVNNTNIASFGDSEKNENFYNLILGTDYHINDYNVLSLTGHFAYEIETEFADMNFSDQNEDQTVNALWSRDESTEATNPKWEYDLQYKKDFKDDKDHTLLFSALGNFFGKDQSSIFNNRTSFGTRPNREQQTRTDFREAVYTFKLDYTKPISEQLTFETGAQYVINDATNDYAVSEQLNDEWVNDDALTNIFDYDQKVLGVYGTGAYEGKKFGLKVGLRMENTDLSTLLVTTNEKNQQRFTNFFPSAHTSYKVTDEFSMQAGYSRRIYRPRLWSLNPFFNLRNNFSIRTGNPDLQPEFTDAYEVNSIYIAGPASFNFGVYYRYTTDVVERIVTFEDNISISKPSNIGTNRATGVEFNAKYTASKWLTINADFNYNYFNREGTFESTSFDFNADQWSSRMTAKLKLPADFDFEVTGNYQSAFKNIQSVMSENLFADLGLRKKILKGKAILNMSVRDVFASRVSERETNQSLFYLYSRSQRGRFVTVGLSFGFGRGEAMEFSGQKHF